MGNNIKKNHSEIGCDNGRWMELVLGLDRRQAFYERCYKYRFRYTSAN